MNFFPARFGRVQQKLGILHNSLKVVYTFMGSAEPKV